MVKCIFLYMLFGTNPFEKNNLNRMYHRIYIKTITIKLQNLSLQQNKEPTSMLIKAMQLKSTS